MLTPTHPPENTILKKPWVAASSSPLWAPEFGGHKHRGHSHGER